MKDKQKYEPNFCVWPQTRFNCSTVLEIPSSSLSIRQGVSGNKAGKRQQFLEAEQHLLWAIGGNLSSPQCGPSDTGGSKYNRSDIYSTVQYSTVRPQQHRGQQVQQV